MLACHHAQRLYRSHSKRLNTFTPNVRTDCRHRSLRSLLRSTAETSSQSVRELAGDPQQNGFHQVRSATYDSSKSNGGRTSSNNRKSSSSSSSSSSSVAAAAPATVAQSGPAAAAGKLPEVLAATFPETFPTLSAARRVIRKDLVLLDGAIGNCNTQVIPGQLLQQLQPVTKKGPRVVSLEVAYEDDALAVVHKPWGVKMYGGDARRTVTGALRAGALNPSPAPDALPEPKPVHRLDAAVGGLLVVAKTAAAAAGISGEFEGRRVHKVYHALLSGRLEPDTAAVDAARLQAWQQRAVPGSSGATEDNDDQGSSLSDAEGQEPQQGDEQQQQQQQQLCFEELLQLQLRGQAPFTVTAADLGDPSLEPPPPPAAAAAAAVDAAQHAGDGSSSSSSSSGSSSGLTTLSPGVYVIDLPLEGKPCYTLLQVLGYSRCARFGGWLTTVALSPVTGRKHQLRQHMAALGHPIVGDGKYALSKEEHISNQGIYLESLEVWFTHPVTQQFLHASIREPQRFATLREQQSGRWRKLEAAAQKEQVQEQAEGAASE
ncbi:pseudouridine synthase [Scenedesmus sp. NREL 46B-D3]|nr:pseudouridine synthase [Scenedesmus sp. NREL 46B-D3]